MVDPHLAELRRAKSLRLGGMSYTSIGDRLGFTWQMARKMICEANETRSQGKLFAMPSMPRRLTISGVS